MSDILKKIIHRIYHTTGLVPAGIVPNQADYVLNGVVVTPFLNVIQINPLKSSTKVFTSGQLADDIKLVAGLEQDEYIVIDVHRGFVTIQIPRPASERGKIIYTGNQVPSGHGLRVSLGLDILNQPLYFDFAGQMNTNMSFLGVPGSGKSVSMRRAITVLARNNNPQDVKFMMIEVSKDGLDLRIFGQLPHLVHPVITNAAEAELALNWAVAQINEGKLPYKLVISIDEVAELVNQRPETIPLLQTLVSQGRAQGVVNLLATQITDKDTLKEGRSIFRQVHNVVVGKVTSKQLSYIIGNRGNLGAEALTGKGDLKLTSSDVTSRFAGIFTTPDELRALPALEPEQIARLPLASYRNTEAVVDVARRMPEPAPVVPVPQRGAPVRDIPVEIVSEGLLSLQRQVDDREYWESLRGREYHVLPVSRVKEMGRNLVTFKDRDQPYIVELYKILYRKGYRLCNRQA